MSKLNKQKKSSSEETLSKTTNQLTMPSRKSRASSCSSGSSVTSSSPPDGSSLSRHQRNLAEKQRRDKLNSYITELASLVPFVAHSSKKLDKTSVLRLTAAHLRLHHSALNHQKNKNDVSWRPKVLSSDNLNELLKAVNGFLVVSTISGKVLFVSKLVETYLGHQDIELIGHSVFYFIHPDDHNQVRTELQKITNASNQKKATVKIEGSVRCAFCARMRERSQPRSEIVNYQLMRFICSYTGDGSSRETSRNGLSSRRNKPPGGELEHGMIRLFVQVISMNPLDELSITEAFQDEYVTQHGPLGEILFADHRISTITGHLPHEVMGMVAYEYIFKEDVPVAQFAQKLMFSSSNGTGMIVYRLMSRDSSAVYLKSIGHLQYDKSSTKVSHFICVNKLLSEEEGKEELKKFKDRYSPRITELCGFASHHSVAYSGIESCQAIDTVQDVPKVQSPPSSGLPMLTYDTKEYQGCPETILPQAPYSSIAIIGNNAEECPKTANQDFNLYTTATSSQMANTSPNKWQRTINSETIENVSMIEDDIACNSLPSSSKFDNQSSYIDEPTYDNSLPLRSIAHNGQFLVNGHKRGYDMVSSLDPLSEVLLRSKHLKYESYNHKMAKDIDLRNGQGDGLEFRPGRDIDSMWMEGKNNNVYSSMIVDSNCFESCAMGQENSPCSSLGSATSLHSFHQTAHVNGRNNYCESSTSEPIESCPRNMSHVGHDLDIIPNHLTQPRQIDEMITGGLCEYIP